jgi:hypothetical protein
MTLPLTKTLELSDFDALAEELQIVDRHFTSASEQHPMRRWEYALALRAQRQMPYPAALVYDVGGAGSPFRYMADGEIRVIDPNEPSPNNYTLEQYVGGGTELGSQMFCLSVLEHVDDLDHFLYLLSCLVAPGGLLFLTMDAWDRETADTAHFHWMRKRIFNFPNDIGDLLDDLQDYGFATFGEIDDVYHGHQLGAPPNECSYTFASLCLRKRV